MAPQTEIPLTGEMSRSDKRVTARYEQLEPVTLNMLSATAVASLYRYDKTIHRIVLSATDNSRVPLLQYGVAGERTVQRCRQKQKDRSMSDLFVCVYVTEIKLFYFRFLSVQSYFFRHFGSVFLLNIDYLISIFIILLKFFFSERKFF